MLALFSAVVLGTSDFLAGLAGRKAAAINIALVSYLVSLVALLALAPLTGSLTVKGACWGLGMGLMEGLAMWWFYQALASGPIAIVAMVTAVTTTSVPVALGMALGERPGILAGAGVLAGLGAVALLGTAKPDPSVDSGRIDARVALYAVGAGAAFSAISICLHRMPAEAGLWPPALARIPALVIFALVASTTVGLAIPRGLPLRIALLLGALNVASMVAAWHAYQTSLLSVTVVLIALYPVATVLLAFAVLGERLSRWQWAGLAAALAAVVMIVA